MKVFVTGAGGFLGRCITEEFRTAGYEVCGLDVLPASEASFRAGETYRRMELPDEALGALLGELRPDVCVHCAGGASVVGSIRDPAADFKSSVVVTQQLLGALRETAPQCRSIFLSSAAVYGQPAKLPVTEDAPTNPLSPYGYHKRICELLFEQAARIHGLPTASLRIFSAYGPGLGRQVLWEMADQLAGQKPLKLKGTGDETRDFVHATDVAQAARVIAEKAPARGEVYNVATETETSIREAAGMICSRFPGADAPEFGGQSIQGDPQRWRADCSRIRALGFVPTLPLEDGIDSLIRWVREKRA